MAGLRLPLGLAPDGVYIADPVTRAAGGLLHRLFTLTTDMDSRPVGGDILSVALAVESPRLGVTQHRVL